MTEEESFIVLEETPSMLQFSLLNVSSKDNDPNSLIETRTKNGNNIFCAPLESDLPNITNSADENRTSTALKTTLAQSFLLGDINCDKIKSYVPSLNDPNHKEDVALSHLIQERNDLKDALQRTNATMRQQYSMVNNWHNSVRELKENHTKELDKYRNINDEIFQQNHDLQEKVNELQHLAELSRKMSNEEELERLNADKWQKEQCEEQIKCLKLELASKIALNVELDEMHREKDKKCEQLKIELVAIQKLYKNASEEIAFLKSQNECLQRNLEQSRALANKYNEKINVIQAQCEVYRTDFELERKQREEMACEREHLLSDIQMLRERNKALVDEAQSYYNESAASLTSILSNNSIDVQKYSCPLCSNVYERLNDLENHVQSCLEKNGQ